MFAALDHGAPPMPAVLPMGLEVIAAAGVWGEYGSVVTMWRDDDDEDQTLTSGRSPARANFGRSLAGAGQLLRFRHARVGPRPDRRSAAGPRGERPGELGRPACVCVAGRWIAELKVMASRAVTTVEVRYGSDTITVAVPASGLVTLPGVIRSVANSAEFSGFDDAGRLGLSCVSGHWTRTPAKQDGRTRRSGSRRNFGDL
jgi:hypothetical protein